MRIAFFFSILYLLIIILILTLIEWNELKALIKIKFYLKFQRSRLQVLLTILIEQCILHKKIVFAPNIINFIYNIIKFVYCFFFKIMNFKAKQKQLSCYRWCVPNAWNVLRMWGSLSINMHGTSPCAKLWYMHAGICVHTWICSKSYNWTLCNI